MLINKMKEIFHKIANFFKQHKLLLCLFITTLLFLVLFFKYIFCNYFYIFSVAPDIGSDTLNTYYPTYYYFSRMIHGEIPWNTFVLQAGLGADYFTSFIKLLLPLEIVMFVFPPKLLPYGILLSVYLKFIVLTIASYYLFQYLFKKERVSVICTIIWTFSSYTMIWGNHYQFLSAIVYFTICMCFFVRFLDKKSYLLFIVAMSFMCFFSYYFFYMFGFFSVIYLIIYTVYYQKDLKYFLITLLRLACFALIAIGISAISLFPSLYAFFNSYRSTSGSQSFFGYLIPYDLNTLFGFIGRLISSNINGDAFKTYVGPSNYYELALLFSSVLFYPALYAGTKYDEKKKGVKLIFILSILLLCFPITSQIIVFDSSTQRWTYMLIFLEVLIIGRMFYRYEQGRLTYNELKDCFVKGFIGYFIFVIVFYFGSLNLKQFKVSSPAILTTLVALFGYSFIIYIGKIKKYFYKFITCILILEVVVNYWSVYNYRGVQTSNTFYSSNYFDSSKKVIDDIRKIDKDIYRIDKTFNSAYLNDSIVQDYNGFKIYNSVLSKNLISYANKNSVNMQKELSPQRCLEISSQNSIYKGLLGEKYLLSLSKINDHNYRLIKQYKDIYVYENLNYVGFAYIQNNKISSNDFVNGSIDYYSLLYSQGYYLTDSSDPSSASNMLKYEKNILKNIKDGESVGLNIVDRGNSLYMSPNNKTDDSQVIFNIDSLEEKNNCYYFKFNFKAEKDSNFQIYYDCGEGFSQNNCQIVYYDNGDNEIVVAIPTSYISRIRIDFSDCLQDIDLNKAELYSFPKNKIVQSLNEIKKQDIKVSAMNRNEFTIECSNNNKQSMLITGLIYDKQWEVMVDGKNVDTYNVNGGLLGVSISSGTHTIELKYKTGGLKSGIYVSLFTMFMMIVYGLVCKIKKYRKENYY